MALVKWTLSDGISTVVFGLNPKDGGSPSYERTLTYHYTTKPSVLGDGMTTRTIAFEGAPKPRELDFSGTLIAQSQHDMLRTWSLKRIAITLTDDLGRSFIGYIKSFKPKRVTSARYSWKHSYDVTFGVLSTSSF
jgi:hypothetical protein